MPHMNRYNFVLLSIILFSNLSCAQNTESISIKDPIIDSTLTIYTNAGYEGPLYIRNKNYIVFQKNAYERKILKNADITSFILPKNNYEGLFAFDKNGVYYNGDFVATDTTGFKFIAEIMRANRQAGINVVWRTKHKIFRNNIEIKEDIDIESFRTTGYRVTRYFKDKNYLYCDFKKVKNADLSSLSESSGDLIYDKKFVYIDGKIAMHNGDTLRSVNDFLMKTSKEVLTLYERKVIPYIDAKTLSRLSRFYCVDKNFAYIRDQKTAVTGKNAKHIKVWDQVNSAYISDGKNVYRDASPIKLEVDAKSFGMVASSDYYFDKSGIYEREWDDKEKKSYAAKFPFSYTKKITNNNTFLSRDYRYLIYENQACDRSRKKMYENLSQEQINVAKSDKLKILNTTDKIEEKKIYENQLYKANNKIYINGTETTADAETFERILDFYKDKNNVYSYRDQKLIPVKGLDAKSVKPFFNFLTDNDYIYYGTNKVIKNKNPEILAIITGNRSGCGFDTTPPSNYYILKNDEGYWLALISNKAIIKFLGNKRIEGIGNIDPLYTPPPIVTPESIEENKIYNRTEVDVMADYKGGIAAQVNFVDKNFIAPKDNGEKIEGKVYLSFVIEKDGTLTDVKVMRDYGYGSGKEALRVLNKMPKWIPAQFKGKPVRTFNATVFTIH